MASPCASAAVLPAVPTPSAAGPELRTAAFSSAASAVLLRLAADAAVAAAGDVPLCAVDAPGLRSIEHAESAANPDRNNLHISHILKDRGT